MHTHGRPRRECAKSDPLALQLIELAVSAGWKPRECIEFAREAHKFVTSTVSEVGAHQTVASAKGNAVDKVARSGKSMPASAPALHRPEWGPDLGTRRKTLQALADQNLMMKEAAEMLGVSLATVGYTAHKLKISFHGRRGSLAHPQINELAIPKLLAPLDERVKRRCPGCSQIFQPTEVAHVLCDECQNKRYA